MSRGSRRNDLLMALVETPSRIWRRIEADEQNDVPSLPDLPSFEHSNDVNATTTSEESHRSTSPIQSTPVPSSAVRLQSSTPSTARFAQSIASRASRSGSTFSSSAGSSLKASQTQRTEISFDDISAIPPYPPPNKLGLDEAEINEDGLDDDLSLAEALQPLSHTGSPYAPEEDGHSNSLKYNYSVSLRSEPKVRHVLT